MRIGNVRLPKSENTMKPSLKICAVLAFCAAAILVSCSAFAQSVPAAIHALAAQAYGARILEGLFKSRIPRIQEAVRFIAGHGEADIKHMEMNRESVSRVSDPEEKRAILKMASCTGWLYAGMADHYGSWKR